MNLSAFKPFFSFTSPSLTYSLKHFYNRIRSSFDGDNFSVIKPASEPYGEVLLGQIPIKAFHNDLIRKLHDNGLVVSCNDHFELAGVGTFCSITPPHSWAYYSVNHHHLPFIDFSSTTDPSLIILTLQRMYLAHKNGKTIYLHCQTGDSRSAFIAALFLCITDKSLLNAENDQQIEHVLTSSIESLKAICPQISIKKVMLTLGGTILSHYVNYWKKTHPEPSLFDMPEEEEHTPIILTLHKMRNAHYNGEKVLFPYKKGSSRGALIAAVLSWITNESKFEQLLKAENDQQIENVLTNPIESLNDSRPQSNVDRVKNALGVDLLKRYVAYWKGIQPAPSLFNRPVQEERSLSANQALYLISQSDDYKFLWDQAYKNSHVFSAVKTLSEGIFEYVENHQDDRFNIDQLIHLVWQNKNKKDPIIIELHDTYLAKQEYIRHLLNYSTTIQKLGLDLLDKILKSDLSYSEKTVWLNITSAYLEDPTAERLVQYNKEIQKALFHPNLTLQLIGGAMIFLGVAVIIVAIVAGFLASGGAGGIAFGIIGAASFGVFQCIIGNLIYKHGKAEEAIESRTLIDKAMEDRYPNNDSDESDDSDDESLGFDA